jgi:hypothetical protein
VDRGGRRGFSLVEAIPLDYQSQVNLGVGAGLLFHCVGFFAMRSHSPALRLLGLAMLPLGTLCFLWGCAAYAKNKGCHEAVGLIGLCGCLGLLVLVVLPYRSRS